MGKQARQAYLKAICERYRRSDRQGKKAILDEFCAVCGYARKYAIRLLNPKRKRAIPAAGQRPGAKPKYHSPALLEPLRRIWLASDQLCGKRLKAALPLWLPHYENRYGALAEMVRTDLLCVSAATLDRLLKPLRVQHPKRLSGTKPGSLLKTQIPIRTHHWDETLPGFMEADTVAHCGTSLSGDFVWSLILTDIVSGWTECRATWNKGAHGVLTQLQSIEAALPFPLRGFDCDNGSEFLNHHLMRYFTNHPGKPSFTRSRPYQKNGRVEMWRGGLRFGLSVAAAFVWRCLTSLAITPFPHPARQTGRAELPHPAFFRPSGLRIQQVIPRLREADESQGLIQVLIRILAISRSPLPAPAH